MIARDEFISTIPFALLRLPLQLRLKHCVFPLHATRPIGCKRGQGLLVELLVAHAELIGDLLKLRLGHRAEYPALVGLPLIATSRKWSAHAVIAFMHGPLFEVHIFFAQLRKHRGHD